MKTYAPGLFEVEEAMPCAPSQIRWVQYTMPSTLGNTEMEEMAARLLEHSVYAGQWLGVFWDLVLGKIKEDVANFDKANSELVRTGHSDSQKLLPQFSCIPMMGPAAVENGMVHLIREGLVRYVKQSDPSKTVFFPTPELIRRIALAQGVIAA